MTIHLMDASADEDSLLLVAEHIANMLNEGQAKTALADTPGSTFLQQCGEALQNQRLEQYAGLMLQHMDAFLSKATAPEAECVANVVVHAISRLPVEQQAPLAQQYSALLISKVDERAEERLGALLNLYGALHDAHKLQRQMLLAAADYARKGANLARIMVPAVRGKSSEWITAWHLSEPEARELLIALSNLGKAGADRASVKEYQRLVGCALELCQPGDKAAAQQLQPLAMAATAEFIRSTTMFQADWAASPAISALASDPATKPLHDLFVAVLSGNLASFKAAATPAALEAAGTTQEAAISKARLVALLVVCGSSNSQEVPLSALSAALDCGPEAVEQWVVRAIGAKLLDAKIDQVRGVVVVSRCTQRTFGTSEWSHLAQQLGEWRSALRGVQATLAQHKGLGAAGQAAQAARPAAVRA